MDLLDFRTSTIHSSSHHHFSSSPFQASRLHPDDFSMYYTDEDEDTQCLIRCALCDFELDLSATRRRLEEVIVFEPEDMVCPVCDEKLGEDALQKLMSQKPSKSAKSSGSSNDSPRIYRRRAARGNKHETRADEFLQPFVGNASVLNSSGMHADKDSTSNASDISTAESPTTTATAATTATATSAPDMGDIIDEQDLEERKLRASFVQHLVLSNLF